MTASPNVSYSSPIRKSGVLVLSGYGVRIQMQAGHLLLQDGIADERRTIRLPRVNHRLKRLIMIGSDGFVTVQALRWLAVQKVAFNLWSVTGLCSLILVPFTHLTLGFDVRRLWHISRVPPS